MLVFLPLPLQMIRWVFLEVRRANIPIALNGALRRTRHGDIYNALAIASYPLIIVYRQVDFYYSWRIRHNSNSAVLIF